MLKLPVLLALYAILQGMLDETLMIHSKRLSASGYDSTVYDVVKVQVVKGLSKSVRVSQSQRVGVSLVIGQLHDDVILLQLPESLRLLFSCAN